MKRILCCLLTFLAFAMPALSESTYHSVRLEFEDGFSLSIPADWVSYEVAPELQEQGYLYCLGSQDGARLMYVQLWPSSCADLNELQSQLETRDDIILRPTGSEEESPFLLYNFAEGDCSGCMTLLDGNVLNLLFTPQSDADNMLIAATVMESYQPTA